MVFTIATKEIELNWISKYIKTVQCADGVIYGVYSPLPPMEVIRPNQAHSAPSYVFPSLGSWLSSIFIFTKLSYMFSYCQISKQASVHTILHFSIAMIIIFSPLSTTFILLTHFVIILSVFYRFGHDIHNFCPCHCTNRPHSAPSFAFYRFGHNSHHFCLCHLFILLFRPDQDKVCQRGSSAESRARTDISEISWQ